MPTITEVAELAGVSTATVSRTLSGRSNVSQATRDRVKSAAATLGYVVSSNASGLATGRTKNVGLVVPFLNRWFFTSIIEGAGAALVDHGYDLTLHNLSGGAETRTKVFEHFLLQKRVDAVIAVSLELTPTEVARLLALNKPIVGVGGPLPGVRTLSIDDAAVARLATEHLLALGHRSIAHLGGNPEHELDFHMPTHRKAGYDGALTAAGITPDPRLFRTTDFSLESGYVAAMQLLGNASSRPTAVFAASDEVAIGTILAARELGLDIPRDLSVIGIDDHHLAGFFGLTTVAQFPSLQGKMAAEILLNELHPEQQEPESLNTALPFELIVRSSTAAVAPG